MFNPLAPLFSLLTKTRISLYKKNIIDSIRLSIPVVSIGNITMGGTGKTPFTLWLLEYLIQQKKIKTGVVVRSYKTSLNHPARVQTNSESAAQFGDEAVLIQKHFPEALVYSGPQKYKTAQFMLGTENLNPQLLLIDDGFQHLKLQRDLDIVLCDTSVPLRDYDWPPFGRARENFAAFARADVIVLTKTEMQNSQTLEKIQKVIPKGKIVLKSQQTVLNWVAVGGHSSALKSLSSEVSSLKSLKIFAFAGLARPENFKNTLLNLGIPIHSFLSLKDHTQYSSEFITELVQKAKDCDIALTTEKDVVKLQGWPQEALPLCVLPLQLKVTGDLEIFYAKLDQILR